MKSFIRLTIIALLSISLIVLISCDKSTKPEPTYDFPDPLDEVASDITLSIYSTLWDTLLATKVLETEGSTTIEFDDSSYLYQAGFDIIAKAEGFYSELSHCNNGDTITIDLDGIPEAANAITGVIIAAEENTHYCYYADEVFYINGLDGLSLTCRTDQQGRFGLGDLPLGSYFINLATYNAPDTFEIVNTDSCDYTDLIFPFLIPIRAPFIYLYPETETNVSIEINFLHNGHITESEPPYGSGWNVRATPDGIIDGQYPYLFYEGVLSVPFNHDTAWLLDGNNLEEEMRNLLEDQGFDGREIDDFVDFWLPVIEGSAWYAFFPQEVESIITLDITPAPDNILRTLFYILSLEQPISISEPDIPGNFSRDGFTVVEWGVIGWHDDQ